MRKRQLALIHILEFSTSRYVRILMTRWLALAVLVSLGAVAVSGQNAVDETRAREIFKQLVEINTTHSVGSTTTAAEAMAARFKAAGFADVRVLEPAPRKGNLVVRYPGSGTTRPFLLLSHLD